MGYDFDTEGKYVNIYCNSMMTYNESKIDTSLNDVVIFFHEYKRNQTIRDLRTNSVMLDYFKKQMNIYNDDFEFKNKQALSNLIDQVNDTANNTIENNKNYFVQLKSGSIDSMRTFFNACVPDGKSYKVNHVKYNCRQSGVSFRNKISDFSLISDRYIRSGVEKNEWAWGEAYLYNHKNETICYTFKSNISPGYILFGPKSQTESPNFFSPWDISQSYYKFKINSLTIDSMNIKIDFKGATEFSKIIPEPDEIGISYVIYTDPYKLTKLIEDGIVFHAKFKDLEGYQQIRLFAITGLMGGLFTVFLFFLFLYPTKIYRQIRMSKTKKGSTNDSQGQSIIPEPPVSEKTDESQKSLVTDDTSEVQEALDIEEEIDSQMPSIDEPTQEQNEK